MRQTAVIKWYTPSGCWIKCMLMVNFSH
jgi:hypothetical protein